MSLRIKSMAVRILSVHGLKLGAQDKPKNQIKPTRYRSLCSLLVSGDAFSASVRMGGGFLMKTDYNRIPNTGKRKGKKKKKALGIHIDTKRMNVGDNVSV